MSEFCSIYLFIYLAALRGLRDLRFPTRDWIRAPWWKPRILTGRPPGNSQFPAFSTKLNIVVEMPPPPHTPPNPVYMQETSLQGPDNWIKEIPIHPKGHFGHLRLRCPVLCSTYWMSSHPRLINAFRTGLKVWSRVPWESPRPFVHKVKIIFIILPGRFSPSSLSFSHEKWDLPALFLDLSRLVSCL